ncbi:hypothetical protein F4779DRAFT_260789 [Xylariaceae sp. FL0662B]|nr:hypothetical protein F4779DRAFT_260789 [Xylariaceae sp. FL0662B]
MPRKIRIPADPARNRQSQQRARARRRELAEALERRLQEYEQRDARATADMQRAARAVARTNESLMRLLARLGVGRPEVEAFLRAEVDAGDAAPDANARPLIPPVAPPRDVVAAPPDAGIAIAPSRSCLTPRRGGAGASAAVSRESLDREDIAGEANRGDEGGTGFVLCGDGAGAAGARERASLTSCDAAADIIATLQGHSDAAQARAVLGCGDVRDCHVRNTRLFQLMDEAT